MRTVVPAPLLTSSSSPPWASTILRAIATPKPAPPARRTAIGTVSLAITSGGIPGPASWISTTTLVSLPRTVAETGGGGVALRTVVEYRHESMRQRPRVPRSRSELTFLFHRDLGRGRVGVPRCLETLHLFADERDKVNGRRRQPDRAPKEEQLLKVVLQGIDLTEHGLKVGLDLGCGG
jgi:hypothetical protein